MIRFVWDRIHSGTDPLCLHGTGSGLEWYGFTLDHLVPDSRSDPYWIHKIPCKHKAYPYQFRTGSKRILCKRCLNFIAFLSRDSEGRARPFSH